MDKPKLGLQQLDLPHFKPFADPIKQSAEKGPDRLAEYRRIAFLSVGLHLCAGGILGHGLRRLSGVTIVRSSYIHIGAILLQSVFHARLRWCKEGVEKGTKELREEFKKRVKETPDAVAPVAKEVFEYYGEWGAIALKYAKDEKLDVDVSALAKRCQLVREERRRLQWGGRASLVSAAAFAMLLGASLYWKRGASYALPLAAGGITASLSLGAHFAGARGWKKLEEHHLKEATERCITALGDTIKVEDVLALVPLKVLSLHPTDPSRRIKVKVSGQLVLPYEEHLEQVKELTVARFSCDNPSVYSKLTRLHIQEASGEEMARIGKLGALTHLRADKVDLMGKEVLSHLPPKLQKLQVRRLSCQGAACPLSPYRYLKKVTLLQFWPGAANALKELSVLEVLKIKSGRMTGNADLHWIVDHPRVQEMRITDLHHGSVTRDELERIHKRYLVYVSQAKDDLKLEELGKALESVPGRDVTFKVRH